MLLAKAALASLGIAGCASSVPQATSPNAPSTTISPCASPTTPTTRPTSNRVVKVNGTGEQTVQLPRDVALPAIVHARYIGPGTFAVDSRPADGVDRVVVAVAKGAYEGTFPVGFVDEKCAPTTALHVEANGPWHLDIASASLAPHLDCPVSDSSCSTIGIRGKGDAVLAYGGPAAQFHITHSDNSSFVLRTYGTSNLTFTRGPGRAAGDVSLAAGPLFLAVTAVGDWSIRRA